MKRSYLLIALLPVMLLFTSCKKSDSDLVLDFMNTWLEQKGMLSKDPETGEYNPTLRAVGVAAGWGTGDDQVDAAVQAGASSQQIKEGDALIDDAKKDYRKYPPDYEGSKKKMDAAVDLRPKDWYYRNERGVLSLKMGDLSAAEKDFAAGVKSCGENAACLSALHRSRDTSLQVFLLNKDTKLGSPSRCVALDHLLDSLEYLSSQGDTEAGHRIDEIQDDKRNCQ